MSCSAPYIINIMIITTIIITIIEVGSDILISIVIITVDFAIIASTSTSVAL